MALEGSIATEALQSVQSFLEDKGSSLSGPGLHAITALLETLESGLNGELDPVYFLSSIDPGIGKTLSVSMFLKAWKDRGSLPASSVLVGVSRLSEIEAYVDTSGLAETDFGVLTRDTASNSLGVRREVLGSVPILFTTQQMIESRTRNRPFSAATEFHYQDEPRTLRIWDESLIPARPLSLRADDLGQLATPLRHRHPKFVEAVEGLQETLRQAKLGEVILVPDSLETLAPRTGVGPAATVKTLARMAGRKMLLVDGGKGDRALIGSAQSLPEDFAPVVILDASGRVRATYRLWEQHRATLRRLPAAQSDYRNLTIRLWQQGTGQATLENPTNRTRIVEAIAKVINDEGQDDWLIVHYKRNGAIFEEVSALVENRPATRLHSLTWGRHHGTNDYAYVSNVVIVGQLNYGDISFHAHGAAASGLPADQLGDLNVKDVAWGEFQHNLLQALCRSSVRQGTRGVAGQCRAYIVTSPHPDIEARVRAVFPGCRLWPWPSVDAPMTGRRGEVAQYLLKAFENPAVDVVRKADMHRHMGIHRSNFSALIKHAEFQDFLGRELIFSEGQRFVKHRVSFAPFPGGGWLGDGED